MNRATTHLARLLPLAVRMLGVLLVVSFLLPGAGRLGTATALPPSRAAEAVAISAEAADSAGEKLRQIREPSTGRSSATIQFSEEEVNSYLYYELAQRDPAAVSKVSVRFLPGRLLGTCEVDFDKAKAARRVPAGMMNYLFWGVHTLSVEGGFSAVNGVGQFDLESVSLDGVPLPRTLVDFLMDAYLKPRFPGLDLGSPFPLPYSIDRVQVMRESAEVTTRPRVSE
ncbi:MAG: hypothetical protein HY651_00330 [Acidobacteria bacterium]|nr:hypothetical protein [Acidobacteriota bacterium]